MKRIVLRWTASFLIAAILVGTVGCSSDEKQDSGAIPEQTHQISTFDFFVGQSALPAQTPIPSPTPMLSASERFQALDASFFRDYVTDDGYTFHQMLRDPSVLGIDPASVPMTLGDFSEEANRIRCEKYESYLEQLMAIPREELTEREQMSCDVLAQYLELSIVDGAYEYFMEPLTGNGIGLQSNLPLALALYEMRTEMDVQNYLLLLGDVPRYYGQIMVYEQTRAERGLFMTETALDSVISDLNTFINAGESLFLIGTFNEAIGKLNALSESQKQDYMTQNETLLKSAFLPSCSMLRDGLEMLRTSCRTAAGMHAEGNKGLAYYELRMQEETGVLLTVDEALELLETTLNRLIVDASVLYMQNPSMIQQQTILTTGDTASDLTYLESLSEQTLGRLPEHALQVRTVPKELQNQLSAAAYVIPEMDGATENVILVNPAQTGTAPLFTAAHETYFGHLYQYVLHRSNEALGLSQRVLPASGLAEGWAQVGTEIMIGAQTKFDTGYCAVSYYNSLISNSILPAIVSILVNDKAYDAAQVTEYLSQFGFSEPAYTSVYMQWAYDMPFYPFRYAIGYSVLSDMLLAAENELGDAFDQSAYLQALMDLGPAPFHILREQMDVWTDERVAE